MHANLSHGTAQPHAAALLDSQAQTAALAELCALLTNLQARDDLPAVR